MTKENKQVTPPTLETLLKVTDETIANTLAQEMLDGTIKPFSVVDLWKIEKTQKNATHWRRSMN